MEITMAIIFVLIFVLGGFCSSSAAEPDVKSIGGKVLFDDNFNRMSTIMLQKDDRETWVEVRSYNNMYRLSIIEKGIMKQDVVANAEVMGKDINSTGRIQ